VAIAFAARHPAVSCVLIGMRSEREVDENLDRFETSVPDAIWSDLASAGLINADVTEPPA
jgi:D-threo-aldose 1-dehydrogenase